MAAIIAAVKPLRDYVVQAWIWLLPMLNDRVPIWGASATVLMLGLCVWCAIRARANLKEMRPPEPVLHLAWHGTARWGWGGFMRPSGMESVLRIQGDAIVSTDNLPELVIITGAHLTGAEYVGNFGTFAIKPGATFEQRIMLNFRGLKPESGKPLTVQITFEDNKGRLYPTKEATFRAFPGPQISPPEG